MIIVVGRVLARSDSLSELLDLSIEHSRRSRKEPGCLSHAVHQDVENPLQLVFVEEWADRLSLEQHFRVPASLVFVKAASALAAGKPTINIFDANPLQF
jgi:quinol monooxygenase YgiN